MSSCRAPLTRACVCFAWPHRRRGLASDGLTPLTRLGVYMCAPGQLLLASTAPPSCSSDETYNLLATVKNRWMYGKMYICVLHADIITPGRLLLASTAPLSCSSDEIYNRLDIVKYIYMHGTMYIRVICVIGRRSDADARSSVVGRRFRALRH